MAATTAATGQAATTTCPRAATEEAPAALLGPTNLPMTTREETSDRLRREVQATGAAMEVAIQTVAEETTHVSHTIAAADFKGKEAAPDMTTETAAIPTSPGHPPLVATTETAAQGTTDRIAALP